MSYLISVVIPAYNVEDYIARCLDSLVEAISSDIEIIVVDDGSKDGTSTIVEDYVSKYTFIKLINQQNAGVVTARLTGLRESTGQWITYVDADDWVDTDFFRCIDFSTIEDDVDLIQVGWRKVSESGSTISTALPAHIGCISVSELVEVKPADLMMYITTSIWGKYYRRELALTVSNVIGDVKIKLYEDILFAISAFFNSKKVIFINRASYNYFQRSGSVIHSYKKNLVSDSEQFLSRLNIILKGCNVLNSKQSRGTLALHEDRLVSAVFMDLFYNNPGYSEIRNQLRRLRNSMFFRNSLSRYKTHSYKKRLGLILAYCPILVYLTLNGYKLFRKSL